MKLKLTLALLAFAGLASAFALASPSLADGGHHGRATTTGTTSTSTTSTGTTTGEHEGGHHHGNGSCQHVELRGSNGSGSVAFTVTDGSTQGTSLVGKQVTLTVPSGASVSAEGCVDASGVLTLRGLRIKTPDTTPTTTTPTTTTTK